jgi:spore coat polysaccharide biosynthesis protein SpsF
VVVATTDHPRDDVIRACARSLDAPVFSGSEQDVLDRTLRAARSVDAELIVQITGDSPLIDPEVVDRTIAAYLEQRPDYACNRMPETYPNGMDTEVFATSVLAEVEGLTRDPVDREHVSLYIYEHPERYRLLNVAAPPEHQWPELRLTLDTEPDYRLISAVYEALTPKDPMVRLADVLTWLRAHPEVLALNAQIQQKPVRP